MYSWIILDPATLPLPARLSRVNGRFGCHRRQDVHGRCATQGRVSGVRARHHLWRLFQGDRVRLREVRPGRRRQGITSSRAHAYSRPDKWRRRPIMSADSVFTAPVHVECDRATSDSFGKTRRLGKCGKEKSQNNSNGNKEGEKINS